MGKPKFRLVDRASDNISDLKRMVAAYRAGQRGRIIQYPEEIRQAVRSAVSGGSKVDEISAASGIHYTSIYGWIGGKKKKGERVEKGKKVTIPRELKIIPNPVSTAVGSVRIHLPNRVMVEIPIGELRVELLREIAGLGALC